MKLFVRHIPSPRLLLILVIVVLLVGLALLRGKQSVAASSVASFHGVTRRCDVLVVGGTPSGIAAALAAARRGAHVYLVEEHEHLGGDIVYAMLNMFDVPMRPNGTSPEAYGIFGEIFEQTGIAFDIEHAQRVLEEKVAEEPNITVLRRVRVVRINKVGHRVTSATVAKVEDLQVQTKIVAKAIVDATNDADLSARAGAHYFLGRQQVNPDKRMQSAGLLFSVSGANWNEMKSYVRNKRLMPAANRIGQEYASDVSPTTSKEVGATAHQAPQKMVLHRLGGVDGNYIWERGDIIKSYKPRGSDVIALSINFGLQGNGNVVLNTLNMVNVNGLSLQSKERARQQAIEELRYFLPYLRKAMPGMENAGLQSIAPELYIRETRHIVGYYTLQVADIKAQRQFPDAVGTVSYPIDLHPYEKGDLNPFGPRRYYYTLPLRSLIPKAIDGVFVASRSLSATYSAAGSARVIPITMVAGEACGVAAWLCATENISPRQIATAPEHWAQVQDELAARGVKIWKQ